MRNRTKAIFWILVVFLAGSVFGGTLTYFWAPTLADSQDSQEESDRRESREERDARIVAHLSDVLELDGAQAQQLRAILEKSRQSHREAHEAKEARFRTIRAETREEIRSILRPDQKEKFENWRQEHDRKRQERKKDGC